MLNHSLLLSHLILIKNPLREIADVETDSEKLSNLPKGKTPWLESGLVYPTPCSLHMHGICPASLFTEHKRG